MRSISCATLQLVAWEHPSGRLWKMLEMKRSIRDQYYYFTAIISLFSPHNFWRLRESRRLPDVFLYFLPKLVSLVSPLQSLECFPDQVTVHSFRKSTQRLKSSGAFLLVLDSSWDLLPAGQARVFADDAIARLVCCFAPPLSCTWPDLICL